MSDLISRKAVYDAVDCMRFASDHERMYAYSLLEQIPAAEPDQFADVSKKGDLINREDALSCFHDWIDQRGDVHTADEMPEYQRIEQLPSAQPEIIRCGDCVLTDGHEPIADGRYWCMLHRAYMYYCSAAERKDE